MPAPPIYNSPQMPTGTRRRERVQHIGLRVGDRPADRNDRRRVAADRNGVGHHDPGRFGLAEHVDEGRPGPAQAPPPFDQRSGQRLARGQHQPHVIVEQPGRAQTDRATSGPEGSLPRKTGRNRGPIRFAGGSSRTSSCGSRSSSVEAIATAAPQESGTVNCRTEEENENDAVCR